MGYFFDTYALIEITKRNPNYLRYSEEPISTGFLNLIEFYYANLRDFDEGKAKSSHLLFRNNIIPIFDEALFEAMKLKLRLKNKNLSYVDCMGYVLAIRSNLKFLTGDKEFKTMANVEFVQ